MKNSIKIDKEFRALIPPLRPGELAILAANIVADGIRDPLVIWKETGTLLDGHNRHDIAKQNDFSVGFEFNTVEVSLPSRTAAIEWIIRNQVGRRNLSESQRAMCAARLADIEHGGDRSSGKIAGCSQAEAAALFNVAERTVRSAKAVLATGSAALIRAVDADEIAVSAAAEIATLPKGDQEDVLKKGKAGISAANKEIKRKKAKGRKAKRAKQKADAVAKNHPLAGESFRLFVGDIAKAGKQIADDSIDAIITDPPYGEEHLPVYEKLATLASRVLVNGGHCLVMVGQANLPATIAALCSCKGLTYQWMLAYLTPGQSTQVFGRKVKSNWKPIIWLVKGKNTWEHVEDSISSDKNDKRFHEWGQSVGGVAQIIERFTVVKSTVLDPFVGGGSTAVAALQLDRLFVGIDIDEASIQETAKRIEESR